MNVLRRINNRLCICMINGLFLAEGELFIAIEKVGASRCMILCSLGIVETITTYIDINSRSEILT